MFFLKNGPQARDRTPLSGVGQMWNDILHLSNPSLGGKSPTGNGNGNGNANAGTGTGTGMGTETGTGTRK